MKAVIRARRRHPGAGPTGRRARDPRDDDGAVLRARGDRGAGTVMVAMTCLVVVTATVVGLWISGWVACRHHAAHAADLGALAGAQAHVRGADACRAARRLTGENGARLVSCRVEGDARTFAVRVRVETDLYPTVGARGRVVQVEAVAGSLHPR